MCGDRPDSEYLTRPCGPAESHRDGRAGPARGPPGLPAAKGRPEARARAENTVGRRRCLGRDLGSCYITTLGIVYKVVTARLQSFRNGCSPARPAGAGGPPGQGGQGGRDPVMVVRRPGPAPTAKAEPARISGLEIPAPNNTMILM